MTVESFCVHHVLGPDDGWTIEDDPRLDHLWLPLIGPTPLCLLRYLNDSLCEAAHSGWGIHLDHLTVDVAEALGVGPKRVSESLYRLVRFGLVFEVDTSYEKPTFIIGARVVPVGDREWRRLPASVRERHADVVL